MPTKLTAQECESRGIVFPCDQMDNGENRYRLMKNGDDAGFGYILTEMPASGGAWQNSHYHKGVKETYIVQKRWIASAELVKGEVVIRIHRENDAFMTEPEVHHNIYMPSGAVIHTVKHGDCSIQPDWFPSPVLDELTKQMGETEMFKRAGPEMSPLDRR
jgi:hypothetical protein